MSTDPQQDRNVEAMFVKPSAEAIAAAEAYRDDSTEPRSVVWQRVADAVIAAWNSRPSQPPQNVEVGDAAKQAEIDYANRREEDTRPRDAAKGEMSVENKKLYSKVAELLFQHGHVVTDPDPDCADCKFLARLRLALSATSSHGGNATGASDLKKLAQAAIEKLPTKEARDAHVKLCRDWAINGTLVDAKFIKRFDRLLSLVLSYVDAVDAMEKLFNANGFSGGDLFRLWTDVLVKLSATSSHGEKGMGEQKGEAGEMADLKEILAVVDDCYEATGHIKVCKTSDQRMRVEKAIIAAPSNAERLRKATEMLEDAQVYVTCEVHTRTRSEKCVVCRLKSDIASFLSPAPAQTPGDERQG